jgi:hypothetical protein
LITQKIIEVSIIIKNKYSKENLHLIGNHLIQHCTFFSRISATDTGKCGWKSFSQTLAFTLFSSFLLQSSSEKSTTPAKLGKETEPEDKALSHLPSGVIARTKFSRYKWTLRKKSID